MIPLFTLEATDEEPRDINGKDATCIITADDTLDYIIKEPSKKNPNMAASEWLCNRFATVSSVPSPVVIKVNYNGNKCVGVRIEGGVSEDYASPNIAEIAADFKTSKALNVVCSAAVIDLFLFNPDRHFNNFLRRSKSSGGGLIAIDYSRAFLSCEWSLPDVREIKKTQTWKTIQLVVALNKGKDQSAIDRVCGKLDRVSTDMLAVWINEMPKHWLSATLRSQVLQWYESSKTSRIDLVREVLDEI